MLGKRANLDLYVRGTHSCPATKQPLYVLANDATFAALKRKVMGALEPEAQPNPPPNVDQQQQEANPGVELGGAEAEGPA